MCIILCIVVFVEYLNVSYEDKMHVNKGNMSSLP